MTPAHRWGIALRRAMRDRGLTPATLAPELGLHVDTVRSWWAGRTLATLGGARAVAETLMADNLLDLMLSLRGKTCPECGAPFADAGKRLAAIYCSSACQGRRYMAARTARRRQSVGSKVSRYREAVGAYCRGCEPAGVCLTADCALRDVSPLPLVRVA